MTFEEFEEFYNEKGIAPGDSFRRKNRYTDAQLETRYKRYCKKHSEDGKTKLQALRDRAMSRDNTCQLCAKLNRHDISKIENVCADIGNFELDMAHIFPRGRYPHMQYDLSNVVMLYRPVHNCLDGGCNPVTGKPCSKEEIVAWWELIVGEDRYERLERKATRTEN